MKKIKQNPWLSTLVLVILAIIIGSNYSLYNLRAMAVDTYQTQQWGGSGFAQETNVFNTKMQNYLKIVNKYIPGKENTKQELTNISKKIGDNPTDVNNVSFFKGDDFFKKVQAFNQSQAFAEATQQEKKYMQNFVEEIKNFEYMMNNHPYQAQAEAFNQEIKKFPASVLKFLTPVRELPVF